MFGKSKNWFGPGSSKPKNVHSLENLRYLHHVLMKNAIVTDSNRGLLVETLRAISEILIWGDQNDSSVFDFFLEKNMLVFFLKILRQKTSRYICVQLLQTLNILFENIRNETSLYYLLSNNHVNSIIVHKFDFSDEEVLAYYISFLKTLSLKLNSHTIHFFYNEHTNDFALYTEAIKFFNHTESMVRIAVRTLTLNVYKVDDEAMQTYIRNRTAVPYFSNLVWFIGNHVLNLDNCVRNDVDHQSKDRLSTLVAEHLDHLHYVNDILSLGIVMLNDVLTDHLLNRLFIPLYVDSLTRNNGVGSSESQSHISSVVALYLLSQVFLILKHEPIVSMLADIIFNGNEDTVAQQPTDISGIASQLLQGRTRGFVPPEISLEQSMEKMKETASTPISSRRRRPNYRDVDSPTEKIEHSIPDTYTDSTLSGQQDTLEKSHKPNDDSSNTVDSTQAVALVVSNCTDEEKTLAAVANKTEMTLANRPYLASIFTALKCTDSDYSALFSLCLLYAIGCNIGIKRSLLESVCLTNQSKNKQYYNMMLIEKLITIMSQACQYSNTKIRPVTLEMSTLLLEQLVCSDDHCFLQDMHLACIEGAKEESNLMLRNFYKGDELFLDMFEDEFQSMKSRPLNVEYLMMDSSLLLPPTATPMTGIDFIKRLPSGELERSRRAIRVFFLLRNHSLKLRNLQETQLPLTKKQELILIGDKLDLNNSDLIACSVLPKDKGQRQRRFLVMDTHQVILVEPDVKRLGWGVVKFIGPLQDVEVQGDKDDSRSLHVTIHKRLISSHAKPFPLLAARFIFDDHIRCMAAKQRLLKGRQKVRQMKMEQLALLLEIPPPASPVGGTFSAAFSSRPGMAVPAGASRKSDEPSALSKMSDCKENKKTGTHRAHSSVHKQTPPVAMTGAPAHLKLSKSKANSSPEVEEAHDAMSPSAYTTTSFVEDIHLEPSDRKLHAHHITDHTPPSLTPAQAPALSLISATVASQNSSPTILPPTSTARVRSLSHPGGEAHDSIPLPFHATGKSPPGIHLNLVSAEVTPGEDQALGSATASLSRLTQMAQDLTTPDEAHFIEMTTLSTETVPIALQEEYDEEDPFDFQNSASTNLSNNLQNLEVKSNNQEGCDSEENIRLGGQSVENQPPGDHSEENQKLGGHSEENQQLGGHSEENQQLGGHSEENPEIGDYSEENPEIGDHSEENLIPEDHSEENPELGGHLQKNLRLGGQEECESQNQNEPFVHNENEQNDFVSIPSMIDDVSSSDVDHHQQSFRPIQELGEAVDDITEHQQSIREDAYI